MFLNLAVYNPTGIVDEFFRTIQLETNFMIEANNILKFRENFKDDLTVKIPKVFLEFIWRANSCYGETKRSSS